MLRKISIYAMAVLVTAAAANATRIVPTSAPGGTDATIADAVTAATAGEEIRVANDYVESAHLVVNKNVTIVSYNPAMTAAAVGAKLGNGMEASAGVTMTLNGFTVDTTGTDMVVLPWGASNIDVTLANCSLARSNPGFGSGIFVGPGSNKHLTLTNTTVTGGSFYGLAIDANPGTVDATNSTISGSSTAGIYIERGANVVINGLSASGNTVGVRVVGANSSATLNQVIINDNTNRGVQVTDPNPGALTLNRCEIRGNNPSAGDQEGAGFLLATSSTLTLSNCIVSGNKTSAASSGAAGVVRANGAGNGNNVLTFTAVNCTFEGNDQTGGTADGIMLDAKTGGTATAYLVNNLFNNQPDNAISLGSNSDAGAALNVSLVNNDRGTAGSNTFATANGFNFVKNESTLNLAAGYLNGSYPFELDSTSPVGGLGANQAGVDLALGAGVVTVPSVDFNGNARPMGGTTPDIGAQESTAVPVTLSSFSVE